MIAFHHQQRLLLQQPYARRSGPADAWAAHCGRIGYQFRRDSIRGLFEANRPRGALWSWVEEENTGHARSDDEIVLPFMAEAIRLRYPTDEFPSATGGVTLSSLNEEDGWLADQSTWTSGLVEVFTHLPTMPATNEAAGWLLNQDMAHLYRAFATYDKPASIQSPESALYRSRDRSGTRGLCPSTYGSTHRVSPIGQKSNSSTSEKNRRTPHHTGQPPPPSFRPRSPPVASTH